MARQDIHIDAVCGEVSTTDNLAGKAIYDFSFLDSATGENNDNYVYGEISVPAGFESRYNDKSGIHIHIPYHPSFKQLLIRFRIDNPVGDIEYLINRTNNSHWFSVRIESESGNANVILLSEFYTYNENGNFNLLMRDGYLALYSGDDTDFLFKPALKQNEIFLLKAFAGNLYQYPTIGVGLIEFLHGNFENSGLAAKLQSEFDNDNMIIHNAYMNSATGELLMDVTEKNGEI